MPCPQFQVDQLVFTTHCQQRPVRTLSNQIIFKRPGIQRFSSAESEIITFKLKLLNPKLFYVKYLIFLGKTDKCMKKLKALSCFIYICTGIVYYIITKKSENLSPFLYKRDQFFTQLKLESQFFFKCTPTSTTITTGNY